MNFYELLFNRGQPSGEGMTHFERLFAAKFGGSPPPEVREYTGAVPVTITADGTPLLDYLITGNTVQNGTPTPDSPVMPQGTGDKTANLFDKSMANLYNHSTLGQTDTWAYSVESTGVTLRIPCDANTQYTLSIGSTIGNTIFRISEISTDDVPIEGGYGGIVCHTILIGDAINNYTFTTASDSKHILFQVNANVMTAALNTLMLNTGSTALPYEPFGVKIPILSASTTTPVYLGEVETERKIKKLVLDGTENFNTDTYLRFSIFISDIKTGSAARTERSYCSHYECLYHAEPYDNDWNNVYYQSGGTLYFHDRRFTTVADFKAYLAAQYAAGTPVTVWYVLAEPTTGIVNEPLMRIGDYADTLSYAQAGANIPTNNGSTTVDVDTTVKPSEVYIKYMG